MTCVRPLGADGLECAEVMFATSLLFLDGYNIFNIVKCVENNLQIFVAKIMKL